jgi:hypothetical protein
VSGAAAAQGYPLASLLAVRERALDAARRALHDALSVERAALVCAAAAADALRAARARAAAHVRPAGPDGGALHAHDRYRARLAAELSREAEAAAAHEERARRATEAARRARLDHAEADRAREVVARHRAAWERARSAARDRAEDLASEDLVTARAARER